LAKYGFEKQVVQHTKMVHYTGYWGARGWPKSSQTRGWDASGCATSASTPTPCGTRTGSRSTEECTVGGGFCATGWRLQVCHQV